MKPLLVLFGAVVAALAGAAATAWFTAAPPVPSQVAEAPPAAGLEELRADLAALERRLAALERAPVVTSERSNARAIEPGAATSELRDPHWYLEQYVRSFDDEANGSEYFRLAVEAHAAELVSPIAALVGDGGRPVPMRTALTNMLGKRRFGHSAEVLDALLAALRPPAPDSLALCAIAALARIDSVEALPGLELALPTLRAQTVREHALALLVGLSKDAANDMLLRLFFRAPDDAMRQLLVRHLNAADPEAALETLRAASATAQPVRLGAARKVGEFDEPGFESFVAQWRTVETDAQVLAALGGADAAKTAPQWSARKATGPPDADPSRDDPNAWASQNADMGLVWLQLTYSRPMRANGVRVFEVNATGAVAEVHARAQDGQWVTLWRGTADGGGQPLWLQFPLTSFAVKSIRLVLDTNRKPGWNEIDAVELLGPDGPQWASRASASSTYAGGGGTQAPTEAYQRAMLEQIEARARLRR